MLIETVFPVSETPVTHKIGLLSAVKTYSHFFRFKQGSHASLKVLEKVESTRKEDRCLEVLKFHYTGP